MRFSDQLAASGRSALSFAVPTMSYTAKRYEARVEECVTLVTHSSYHEVCSIISSSIQSLSEMPAAIVRVAQSLLHGRTKL